MRKSGREGTYRSAFSCFGAGSAEVTVARPPPPCFSDVWQGKDLWEGDFVCVAGKGLTGVFFACVAGKELSQGEVASGERPSAMNALDKPVVGESKERPPHPRAIQMNIKTSGLREKQFVRI